MVKYFTGLPLNTQTTAPSVARKGAQLFGGKTETLSFALAAIFFTTQSSEPKKLIKYNIEQTGIQMKESS